MLMLMDLTPATIGSKPQWFTNSGIGAGKPCNRSSGLLNPH